MAVIITLKKTGKEIKTKVKEDCKTIWAILNHASFDPNSIERLETKDWIRLTDLNGKPVIINKRYIFKIYED